MSDEYGAGFSVANIKNCRQLYLTFPKAPYGYSLIGKIHWSHLRTIMRLDNEEERNFYVVAKLFCNTYVNGVKTELKTLKGSSLNTPVTRIQEGFGQGAETVIIDDRKIGMTLEQADNVIKRVLGIYKNTLPGIVEIWTKEGIIRRKFMDKWIFITEEEKEKCQRVADAYSELYDITDVLVVDAGRYGFVKLQYFNAQNKRMNRSSLIKSLII